LFARLFESSHGGLVWWYSFWDVLRGGRAWGAGEEAGSPVRSNSNYPLKALYSVDNVCREAFGFAPTGYEPQLCPRVEPTRKPRTPTEQPGLPGCAPHPPCDGIWTDYPNCFCNEWPA
jgi:hypothetical protein